MRLLLVLVFTLLPASAAFPRPPNVGDVAPDWTLENKEGESVNYYEASEGKVSIVLFWATWCPYCRRLMPHLQSVIDECGEKVDLIAISIFEEDDADPAGYLAEYGYQFRLIEKGEEIAELYGVRGTPGLFLVDREGQIRWHLHLAMQDEARLAGLSKHWERAARRAPFWAAELRKALDDVIEDQSR